MKMAAMGVLSLLLILFNITANGMMSVSTDFDMSLQSGEADDGEEVVEVDFTEDAGAEIVSSTDTGGSDALGDDFAQDPSQGPMACLAADADMLSDDSDLEVYASADPEPPAKTRCDRITDDPAGKPCLYEGTSTLKDAGKVGLDPAKRYDVVDCKLKTPANCAKLNGVSLKIATSCSDPYPRSVVGIIGTGVQVKLAAYDYIDAKTKKVKRTEYRSKVIDVKDKMTIIEPGVGGIVGPELRATNRAVLIGTTSIMHFTWNAKTTPVGFVIGATAADFTIGKKFPDAQKPNVLDGRAWPSDMSIDQINFGRILSGARLP